MLRKSNLKATVRHAPGHNNKARSQGFIPAIVYGGDNQMISLFGKDFLHKYTSGQLSSALIELELEHKNLQVVIRAVQCDPVSDQAIHVDFQEVFADQPIKVYVPVHVQNADKCGGIKRGGVLNIVTHKIAIRCLPSDIPQEISVDVKDLKIGDVIHINDLKLGTHIMPVDKSNFSVVSIAGRVEESEAGQNETVAS